MIFQKYMQDDAVLWEILRADGEGWYIFSPPVSIKTKWNGQRVLFTDSDGEEVFSNAVVTTLHPVKQQSYLYLGHTMEADPKDAEGSFAVQNVQCTGAVGGQAGRMLYEVYL